MNINKALKSVLITLVNNDAITASWGISNIDIKANTLSFDVSGLMYKGSIKIETFNEYEFFIHIGGQVFTLYNVNDLSVFLDKKIERTPDYISDLEQWLSKD